VFYIKLRRGPDYAKVRDLYPELAGRWGKYNEWGWMIPIPDAVPADIRRALDLAVQYGPDS
jgi:hypothetical protein